MTDKPKKTREELAIGVLRTCLGCGLVFAKASGRTEAQFARQKYCSAECRRAAGYLGPSQPRAARPTPRSCEFCGGPIPYTNGAVEYLRRRFCGRDCKHAFDRGTRGNRPYQRNGESVKDCTRSDCAEFNPQPIAQFSRNSRITFGLEGKCKTCQRRDAERWRAEHPEPRYDAEYQRNHHLMRQYGITANQYDALLANQGGVCAVCRRPERIQTRRSGKPSYLAVDHARSCCSGKKSCGRCIRGLLCFDCNTAIGRLDDGQLLRAAVDYVERPLEMAA